MNDRQHQIPEPAAAGSFVESAAGSVAEPGAGSMAGSEYDGGSGNDVGASLPVMPGFREMALRRSADAQAARMAGERSRLVRELAEQRQAAGLSQTEIAARMGTSQAAVARLAVQAVGAAHTGYSAHSRGPGLSVRAAVGAWSGTADPGVARPARRVDEQAVRAAAGQADRDGLGPPRRRRGVQALRPAAHAGCGAGESGKAGAAEPAGRTASHPY